MLDMRLSVIHKIARQDLEAVHAAAVVCSAASNLSVSQDVGVNVKKLLLLSDTTPIRTSYTAGCCA